MIQIRQSIFETNSSSSHSIVVRKRSTLLDLSTDGNHYSDFASFEDGVLSLRGGNHFGWGWDVLTNWLDRFAYAMASLGEDKQSEILDGMKERLKCEIEITECVPWWGDGSSRPDYGDVDHQSCGLLGSFLLETGIDVMDFIFDDKYVVIIDNDNNDMDAYNAFIAKLDIEKEYNTWM